MFQNYEVLRSLFNDCKIVKKYEKFLTSHKAAAGTSVNLTLSRKSFQVLEMYIEQFHRLTINSAQELRGDMREICEKNLHIH